MKFAEAFAAEPPHRQGPDCSICVLLAGLDEGERKDIVAAMESDAMTTVIHRALRRAGYEVSASTLTRHRKGECRGIRR